MMQRLRPIELSRLPPAIRQPRYDRDRLHIGMAHVGVGAFHRCHQAEFTDDMLEAGFGPWGIVGINIRPPRLGDTLGAQQGLYSRTLRTGATGETRVIGCIKRTIDAITPEGIEAAIAALAASDVHAVTLTLTEKGYCHIPATGELDAANPDVAHDLAHSQTPRTALGLLAAAFERRRFANGGPLTVISCDNLPSNGALLTRTLAAFTADRPAAARSWIADNVACPNTMVDRIVPATTAADIDGVAARLGVLDLAAVVGEPFRQWVIADTFAGPRPAWDRAGAQFVGNVQPYEIIKMRVLNAAQSTLSHLGPFLGHEFSYQAAADPVLARPVQRMLRDETAATLPKVAGMEAAGYIATTFERIGNSAIRHRCHQIGTDGSQKIVQRILRPLRERLARGQPAPLLTLAAASWIAYVLAGAAAFGCRWAPDDPYTIPMTALAETCGGNIPALTRQVLAIRAIFGEAPWPADFHAAVAAHIAGLMSGEPRRYLAAVAGP